MTIHSRAATNEYRDGWDRVWGGRDDGPMTEEAADAVLADFVRTCDEETYQGLLAMADECDKSLATPPTRLVDPEHPFLTSLPKRQP